MTVARSYKCEVCGYVHRGDAPPSQCPVCGVGPEEFSLLEAVAETPAAAPAQRWRCVVCDYLHEGDAPPATCPVCGADTSLFEPAAPPEAPAVGTGSHARIVVVGAGVAGTTAAEEARRRAPDAHITLVSKEQELPYYRLNLTRLLAGEIGEAELPLQPASWYATERIELRHDTATAIDRAAKQVELASGAWLPYDRLILATGAHAFVPPIPGTGRAGVLTIRSWGDVRTVLARVTQGTRVACVGGGLLGLETAGALRRHAASVTVVEGYGWLLPRQLAEPAGALLRRRVEQSGIEVRCAARVEELVGDEEVRGVRLGDGTTVPAELVIVAAGVRPNSYLARLAGLTVTKGVVVDDRMQSSDEAIFAVGDVAEHRGAVVGLWPHAYAQGMVAGANAAGGAAELRPTPPSNRLKVLGIDLFSIGDFLPADASYLVVERTDAERYVRLVTRDGRLVGANLLGDTSLAGSLKGWIESGTQLAELVELCARFPELARG